MVWEYAWQNGNGIGNLVIIHEILNAQQDIQLSNYLWYHYDISIPC